MLIEQAFSVKRFFVGGPPIFQVKIVSLVMLAFAINYLLKRISRFLNIKFCQVQQKTLDSVIYQYINKGYRI